MNVYVDDVGCDMMIYWDGVFGKVCVGKFFDDVVVGIWMKLEIVFWNEWKCFYY